MKRLVLPLMMYKESGSLKKGNVKTHNVVPTWNHLYDIYNNRPTLSKWTKKHFEHIKELGIAWTKETGWETTQNTKVFVRVWVFFPDKIKRDTHNLTKIFDPLQDVIFDDDYYAIIQFQDFTLDKENPRIEIEFEVDGRE